MKSKPAVQGSPGALKTPEKDCTKSPKSVSQKKFVAKRTAIKLRASTEKYVAKRTREKSPKLSNSCQKNSHTPSSGGKATSCISLDLSKSKSSSQKKSEEVLKGLKKAVVDKKSAIIKAKSVKSDKKMMKAKVNKQTESNAFIDLWAFTNMGKREASLNASMKVNIMYERHSPVKSVKPVLKKVESGDDIKQDKLSPKGKLNDGSDAKKYTSMKGKNSESHKEKVSPKGKTKSSQSNSKKSVGKNELKSGTVKSNQVDSCSRKRKSPAYKIFKPEPPAKCRKMDQTKTSPKQKSKLTQKSKKTLPPGHQLSNIIEKSPRQASLFAKAMIAMEQEEDTVFESAARTRIFDWMELRPYSQSDPRRIRWISGLQNTCKGKEMKCNEEVPEPEGSPTAQVDVSGQPESETKVQESESLHNTLLRTLHQIGDSRLLKEYLRAQKEDFRGSIDVEKCATPEKQRKMVSPEPKKIISPSVIEEKAEKVFEKPANYSPTKPQPCRVATPIPQFPVGQRTSHMTSYIHHPIAQPIYQQQHHHPQPIKVTPYTPSPAFIYPGGLYAQPSPSPMSFGVGNNEISPSNYSSTFTLNHMGSLSLGRRGVNPYQPSAYNPAIHVPMQQIGFNFPAYYPASLQALPQQNIAPIQPLPLHQQYPMVQPPVITHQLAQDVGQLTSYQPNYTQYPHLSNVGQNTNCMPPPPAHSHRPTPMGPPPPPPLRPPLSHQTMTTVSPMESLRSMNPIGVQSITRSPALDFSMSSEHCPTNLHRQTSAFPTYSKTHHESNRDFASKGTSISPLKFAVNFSGLNNSFSQCKKEQEETPAYHCDLLSKSNNEVQPKSSCPSESSDVSDLLHSAHTTMYQIDGINSLENIREFHQTQASVSCNSTVGNSSPSKISIIGHASFNASYSVSSILDMPSHKVKCEPTHKNCAVSQPSDVIDSNIDKKLFEQTQSSKTSVVCFTASAGSLDGSDSSQSSNNTPVNTVTQKYYLVGDTGSSNNGSSGSSSNSGGASQHALQDKDKPANLAGKSSVIIIDDTDESSDDEPLAKLVKLKTSDDIESQCTDNQQSDKQKKVDSVIKSKQAISHSSQEKPKVKSVKQSDIIKSAIANKLKVVTKKVSQNDSKKGVSLTSVDSSKAKKCANAKSQSTAKRVVLKPHHDNTSEDCAPVTQSPSEDELAKSQGKDTKGKGAAKKSSLSSSAKIKKLAKKTKAQPQWPQTPPRVNTNHGWTWLGEGDMKPIPKLTVAREESVRIRKFYQSMQHSSGEIVSLRDCVILQSDGDGSIPYVAKVSALWENLNGEMMFSMLWFYQPEHTATGREPEDGEQELFASKHREENSVACIDDKCYVLTYNEYCRLEAEAVRLDQGVPLPRWREQMPGVSEEDKKLCKPLPPANTCVDNIWFCRYDYDIRKKIVKKPKHKKSNLRYRAPFVMV